MNIVFYMISLLALISIISISVSIVLIFKLKSTMRYFLELISIQSHSVDDLGKSVNFDIQNIIKRMDEIKKGAY